MINSVCILYAEHESLIVSIFRMDMTDFKVALAYRVEVCLLETGVWQEKQKATWYNDVKKTNKQHE